MPSSTKKTMRGAARLRRAQALCAVVALATVLGGFASTTSTTNAWFTTTKAQSDNTLQTATLQPVSGLSATSRNDGVNIRWQDALQQPWGSSKSISTKPTYTVNRVVDGGASTQIYSGSAPSTSDAFPHARTTQTNGAFSAGVNVGVNLRSDGTVWSWGASPSGALGTNTTSNAYAKQLSFPGGRLMNSVTMVGYQGFATGTDGTVWEWGPYQPVCGSSAGVRYDQTPVQTNAPAGKKIVAVSVPSYAGCQILELASDGTLWVNIAGNVSQVKLPGDRKVSQLTKGTVVLASDGSVWGWGMRERGQLADGTTGQADVPISSPVQAILPAGTRAVRIAAYKLNLAVLLDNNTIWTSGWNYSGTLGAGLATTGGVGGFNAQGYLQRYLAPANKTWKSISVGFTNIAAVATDGTIYVSGAYGRLGNGSTTDSNVPVAVTQPDRVSFQEIDLSDSQVLAPDQNGTFWGWGQARTYLPSAPGTPVATFGDGTTSTDTYQSPMIVATNQAYTPVSTITFCDNGGQVNSAGYCPPGGTISYSVTYSYFSWNADVTSVPAATTAIQTGSAIISGPGSSSLCLTIQGNGSADGTPVVLAGCDPTASGQRWSTWSDGTFRANGKCLDMKGNTPGVVVQLWNCNGLGYQWWVPRSDGSLYNPTSGLCLNDPTGVAGLGVQQEIATCNGSASQRWKLG